MNRRSSSSAIYTIIASFVAAPLSAFSSETGFELSIAANNVISACRAVDRCEPIAPTGDLKEAVDGGYENLSIVDIYHDGAQEVAATSPGGCTRFFRFDKKTRTFSAVLEEGRDWEVCNYRLDVNRLTSNYKLDAKTYEDVYELDNGEYRLIISDACVGCEEITRTIYVNGHAQETLLVTNDEDYRKRQPLTAFVVAKKAWLYGRPSSLAKTKSYVIKGNVVRVLKFDDNSDFWCLVEYISENGIKTKKWMECTDLSICR